MIYSVSDSSDSAFCFFEFHSMVVRILFGYLSFDPCEVLVACGLTVEDDLVV